MLARRQDACSRSCTLFGRQVSHTEWLRTTGEFLPRGKN